MVANGRAERDSLCVATGAILADNVAAVCAALPNSKLL
jgi:hypothetical protein